MDLNVRSPCRQRERVVVIGAGVAGLSCAKKLMAEEKGRFDVTVLEARERIGGRVSTCDGLEEGANWIHEYVKANPLFELAGQAGMEGVFGDRYSIRVLKGKRRYFFDPGNRLGKALKKIDDIVDSQKVTVDAGSGAVPRISVEQMTEEAAREHCSPDIFSIVMAVLLEIQKQDWAKEPGAVSFQGINAGGVYSFREFGGEDYFIINGMARLIDKLSEGIGVRTGARVVEAAPCNQGVKVSYLFEGKINEILAAHVVSTLPLGVLQSGACSMPLTDRKKLALSRLKMGTAMKIIMQFDKPYWDAGEKSAFWIIIGEERANHVFFNLHKVSEKINTLVGWAVGDEALALEKLQEKEVRSRFLAVLQRHFPECVGENLKDFRIVTWDKDPLTGGAYTHIPLGVSPEEIDVLARPIGRLHFAGEHTSEYLGTLHGAFLSGERAAREIMKESPQSF